jgi:hypothetical protein
LRLNRPTGITEDPEHHLSYRSGTLVGLAQGGFRLSEGNARQQTEKADKQHLLAANNALCRPDSHLHAGILFDRNEMMPQR